MTLPKRQVWVLCLALGVLAACDGTTGPGGVPRGRFTATMSGPGPVQLSMSGHAQSLNTLCFPDTTCPDDSRFTRLNLTPKDVEQPPRIVLLVRLPVPRTGTYSPTSEVPAAGQFRGRVSIGQEPFISESGTLPITASDNSQTAGTFDFVARSEWNAARTLRLQGSFNGLR